MRPICINVSKTHSLISIKNSEPGLKRQYKYISLLLLLIAGISGCNTGSKQPRLPDLTETYSAQDKKPFGGYIAYHQLEQLFYSNNIRTEKSGLEDNWIDKLEDSSNVYISISKSFYTTDADVMRLDNMAQLGNDVFISAGHFEENLLNKFDISYVPGLLTKSFTGFGLKESGVKLHLPVGADTSLYRYYYFPLSAYFTMKETRFIRVLGRNEQGLPDFIVIFRGKGRLFLHCEPRTFSNYFLLQRNNYEYMQKLMGYMNTSPDHVYWNEFYQREQATARRSRQDHGSGPSSTGSTGSDDDSPGTLSEILSQPALASAFWLGLVSLILLVVFGAKRRQRMIREIKPNENTSVAFTETIGRLYLQKKDNRNIADKMITYFNEHVRNTYFLNTSNVNEAFITTLSRKSGAPRELIEKIYHHIADVHKQATVSDYLLLSLNTSIQKFYKTLS